MECLGVQRRAVEVEAPGEFRGEMLCVGGATPVAAEMDLAALAQGFDEHICSLLYAFKKLWIVQYRLFHGDGLLDGLENSWVHRLLSYLIQKLVAKIPLFLYFCTL